VSYKISENENTARRVNKATTANDKTNYRASMFV